MFARAPWREANGSGLSLRQLDDGGGFGESLFGAIDQLACTPDNHR